MIYLLFSRTIWEHGVTPSTTVLQNLSYFPLFRSSLDIPFYESYQIPPKSCVLVVDQLYTKPCWNLTGQTGGFWVMITTIKRLNMIATILIFIENDKDIMIIKLLRF